MDDIRFGIELELIYFPATHIIEVRNILNNLMKENNIDIQFQVRNYGDINYKIWKIIKDISVAHTFYNDIGFEIISPVLTLSELPLIEKLMDSLSKLRIFTNISCGFHVHFSFSNRRFQNEEIKKFVKTYIVFEDGIDILHNPYRQKNAYCKSIRENTKFKNKNIKEIFQIIDKQYFRYSLITTVNSGFFNRHYKINLQP